MGCYFILFEVAQEYLFSVLTKIINLNSTQNYDSIYPCSSSQNAAWHLLILFSQGYELQGDSLWAAAQMESSQGGKAFPPNIIPCVFLLLASAGHQKRMRNCGHGSLLILVLNINQQQASTTMKPSKSKLQSLHIFKSVSHPMVQKC